MGVELEDALEGERGVRVKLPAASIDGVPHHLTLLGVKQALPTSCET